MLRRAWIDANNSANTLLEQLQNNAQQAAQREDEEIESSASNSHSSSSYSPGLATATAAEKSRAWTQMIEGFQTAKLFLYDCSAAGLDAFVIQYQGCFPNPLPVANPAVIVDSLGKWQRLAVKYGDKWITPGVIIGEPVSDAAVYLWLLQHPDLLNITKGVTEQRGEFTEAIIGRTGGVLYA